MSPIPRMGTYHYHYPGPETQESPESTKSQECPLSPGWVHTITIILGQKLQKWVLYYVIDDPINFWLDWDPSDPDDIRMIEKYVESNGSTVYLPNCTVKVLISLWNFMDLLINQDKPADHHGNRLYYVRDEKWTKLTAKDMRTALVNAKSEQRSSSMTSMPSFRTTPSSAPIRSPMNLELASFKKSMKREASAYSVLKDEHFFDKFQRDLLITAKSHDVSEILDPLIPQVLRQRKQNYLKPNKFSCIKSSMKLYRQIWEEPRSGST